MAATLTELAAMNQPNTTRRRTWPQFSLRAMFVVITVLAIWLGYVFHNARELRRSVDEIEAAGGAVFYRHQMEKDAPPPGPAWLRRLVGDEPFITPSRLDLTGPDVTDEFVAENLRCMASVEDLNIESPNVTDAALVHIDPMRDLHFLSLDCPRLTDAAMTHIASRPELYRLTLKCPRLTDAALPHIATLPKLGGLVLNSPHLTAPGIRQLAPLKHLEYVTCFRDPRNRIAIGNLHEPSIAEFDGTPLIDVLEYLVDYHADDPPINYDDVSAEKLQVPITVRSEGQLQWVLEAILEPCELGYYVEEGTVRIAPRQTAEAHWQGKHAFIDALPSLNLDRSKIDW